MRKVSTFSNMIAAATLCSMVATPALSQVVGVNTAVRKNVMVRQDAASDARQAQVKQRVTLGNQVETGSASSLQVTLLDRTTFTVGPNAKFTVNKFVYDPTRKKSSVGASVAKGTFRMLSGKAAKGGGNQVTTPAATIGIRGTMLEGSVGADALALAQAQGMLAQLSSVDPATATMIVLRGPGPRAQTGETQGEIEVTAGGRSVIINTPGQAVFVPFAGAAPIGPFQLSTTAYSQFDVMLRTSPQSFAGTMASLQQLSMAGGTPGSAAGSAAATGAASGGAAGTAAGASAGGGGLFGSFGLFGVLGALAATIATLTLTDNDDKPISA